MESALLILLVPCLDPSVNRGEGGVGGEGEEVVLPRACTIPIPCAGLGVVTWGKGRMRESNTSRSVERITGNRQFL